MRAILYEAFGAPPQVTTVADSTPPPGGAVLRVTASGLCRSDWHGWRGHDADIEPPHVPGHELAGELVALGEGVSGWAPGTRVTAPFICACGGCRECLAGQQQVCEAQQQPGFTHWGSFAEYVVIHRAALNLVALPEGIDDATAASLGCRFATSFRAVVDVGRVRGGEWVAVHGCGGVGCAAVMIARALGAAVIALDPHPARRQQALDSGASHALAPGPEAIGELRELSDGGVHCSIDAVGGAAACAASIASLRRRGRHVQVGLMGEGPVAAPMGRVLAEELQLLGSHGMPAHRYKAMLAMIADGRLRPDALVGEIVGLAEGARRLTTLDQADTPGVTVIDPRQP